MRVAIIAGIPILIHPLLPVMACFAAVMGQLPSMCALCVGLLAHECAHAAAARALSVPVMSVEFMPFGGIARISDVFLVSPLKTFLIAIAGPVMSLLMAIGATLPGWLGIISPSTVGLMLKVNLSLMLFNLLPAMPLDGGRMLYALISAKWGIPCGMKVTCALGGAFAVLMACASAFMWLNGGLNLALPLAAAYMYLGAQREGRDAHSIMLRELLTRRERMSTRRMVDVRTLAVLQGVTLSEIASALTPNRAYMVAVLDDNKSIMRWFTDAEIISAYFTDPKRQIGEIAAA